MALFSEVNCHERNSREAESTLRCHGSSRAEGKTERLLRRREEGHKLSHSKAWRMSWFLKFDGESGLDAGGLSRDFWRLCLAKAFDENNGLFRRLMRKIPHMMS